MTTSVNSVNQDSGLATTNRLFAGFLNSIVGADNNYVGEDGYAVNTAGQYVIANPDGTVSVLGQARSNVQGQTIVTGSPTLLVWLGLGALVYFLFKKA